MTSERGALVRGSAPPLCSQNRRWCVAGAGQASDINIYIWAVLCTKQATKNKKICPSSMPKNIDRFFFPDVGEERRTLRVISRPLDHGTTWYLRGGHLYLLALPDTMRGWPWVDSMSRSKAYRRVSYFWSACWIFSTWNHKFHRMQPRRWNKQRRQNEHFYIFLPVFLISTVRE